MPSTAPTALLGQEPGIAIAGSFLFLKFDLGFSYVTRPVLPGRRILFAGSENRSAPVLAGFAEPDFFYSPVLRTGAFLFPGSKNRSFSIRRFSEPELFYSSGSIESDPQMCGSQKT